MALCNTLRSLLLSPEASRLSCPYRPSSTAKWTYVIRAYTLPPSRLTFRRVHRSSFRYSAKDDDSSRESPSSNQDDQGPPQEAILKAISEVSKTEGRVAQTTNIVIGGTVTDDATDEWLVLDQKVNSYPTIRGFTAIGTGGDDFVQSMIIAVESVLQQPISKGNVTQKLSSGGKYVSVKIGPVQVASSEQVQAVYNAMRRDDRMKYFL